jgi:dienelactone hydrolase
VPAGTDPGAAVGTNPAPVIQIQRDSSQLDADMRIAVAGLPPGQPAEIEVSTRDESGTGWKSRATFAAGADGVVDPATQPAVAGTYRGADQAGLFWSMRPDRPGAFFDHRIWTPVTMRVTVIAHDSVVAVSDLRLTFAADGITRRLVSPDGLPGRFFSRDEPAPGVLLLAGSDAAALDPAAALLASHGYAVLFLPYFGLPGLPPTLERIDLGYVVRGIDWLLAQPQVRGNRVAVMGLSRGAELALQVASMDERVGAVVAAAPSYARHAGIGRGFSDFTQPAWLSDGEAMPYLRGRMTPAGAAALISSGLRRRPLRQTAFFRSALRSNAATRAAAIEVEKIRGPVLTIAGGDDGLWPSDRFAERIAERLARHAHPFADASLLYSGAGHFVSFPYALPRLPPMTVLRVNGRLSFDFGGTPQANAAAAAAAWPQILRFTEQSLT